MRRYSVHIKHLPRLRFITHCFIIFFRFYSFVSVEVHLLTCYFLCVFKCVFKCVFN